LGPFPESLVKFCAMPHQRMGAAVLDLSQDRLPDMVQHGITTSCFSLKCRQALQKVSAVGSGLLLGRLCPCRSGE
jgi:hypothetical protein